MSRREHGRRDDDVDVVEVDVGTWGSAWPEHSHPEPPAGHWPPAGVAPSAGPPPATGPPVVPPQPPPAEWTATGGDEPPPGGRALAWLRGHVRHVAAAAAAVVLLGTVVAVASGSGSDPEAAPTTPPSTAAPSTTERRPISTPAPSTTEAPAPQRPSGGTVFERDTTDYRFALAEVPDGFEVTGADEIEGGEAFLPAEPMLFAAGESTWADGPWLLVATSDEQNGIGGLFPFTRPPARQSIDGGEALTGAAPGGIELTVVQRGTVTVTIAARGLAPLTTAVFATALGWSGDAPSVADDAVPAELRRRTDLDYTRWLWGWSPDIRANVSYGGADGSRSLSISVRPVGTSSMIDSAPFFLADLRYLVSATGEGVAGTLRQSSFQGAPTSYAIWRRDDREYVATGYGMTPDDVLAYTGRLVQAGDPDWRTDLWNETVVAARNCCDSSSEPVTAISIPATSPDQAYVVDAWAYGDSVGWQVDLGRNGESFGLELAPPGSPFLQVGTRYWWPGMQTDDFPVAAVALVDRSMVGSVLRLSTTGSVAQTVEIELRPVEGDFLAPYLAGAAVLPWTDGGLVAQLVGPDGQTIALQTDADLQSL